MFISKLSIKNFRNFDELVIDGLQPGTVFVGENGVGKSNLLYALRLALDASLADSARTLRAEDFWDGLDEPFHGAVIEVQVQLQGWDKDKVAQALFADCVVGDDPLTAQVTYLYRPRPLIADEDEPESEASSAAEYEWIISGGQTESMPLGGSFRRSLSLRLLPALRDAEADLQSWRRSPLSQLLGRIDVPRARLVEVAEHVDAAAEKLLEDGDIAKLNTDISEQIEEMVGELFAVTTTLGMAATRPENVLRSVRLMIEGETARSVSEVSLGTANILFLALLIQNVLAQQNDRVNTLLAVEEPEAHLHPHVQRVLFRYLLRMGVPLLLTTHSAHIASVADLRALVLLRDVGQSTEAFSISSAGLSDQAIDDLNRYLDVTRSELIFAKAAILVEGIAELYLIPAFAAAAEVDLDELGVTVASVHGADFRPFHRMLGSRGFDIPHVVVTDGDTDKTRRGLTHAGLRRGARLLGNGPPSAAILKSVDDGDYEAAYERLRKKNVFVGEQTLEVDLVATCSDAMSRAYAALGSAKQAERFEESLSNIDTPVGRAEFVRRIEALGKGRFAQRLASDLDGAEPPAYIANAIEAIRVAAKA